jgi:hypothetical protein
MIETVLHSGIFGVTFAQFFAVIGRDVDQAVIRPGPKRSLFLGDSVSAKTVS